MARQAVPCFRTAPLTFAGYREDDFTNAGRRGRISDGVMVLWPQIRDRKDVYS